MALWNGYPDESAWDTAQPATPAFRLVDPTPSPAPQMPPEAPKASPWVPAPPAQRLPDATAEPYAAPPRPQAITDYARTPQKTFSSYPGGPKLARITSPSGAPFSVNAEHGERFSAFLRDLEDAGYVVNPKASGGYNYRPIAGTNTLSKHAHGNAIDINWDDNPRGGMGKIPADVARSLAKKHGLIWGGDWKNPDPMHFEIPVPGEPGHTYGDGHNHGAPSATAAAASGPVASANPRSTPMPDTDSGGGFFSFLGKPMNLFGNPENADIMARAGPQGYQPVDAADFIKRHPALKGVEGVDQLIAVSNLQRDLASGALKQPQTTWGQGIGELLKGIGATLTSRTDPRLAYQMAGTVGQQQREQQDLVKKMQMQALLQQASSLGGDLGDVVKANLTEERKRKADREKMLYGEYGVVPPSLSGSPVSPGAAAAGAAAPGGTPPVPSATAAPVVPGTVLGSAPPGLLPTQRVGSAPAAPGAAPAAAPSAAPASGLNPINENLIKSNRYLIMGDTERAKEYRERAKIEQDERKYAEEVQREVDKQKALVKLKSDQADEDKSKSRDQTRENLLYSLDAIELLANDPNIEGAIGPFEGNEYVQRLKGAMPWSSGAEFTLNRKIMQQASAIKAQMGSGLFKGEGPLSEGERNLASAIAGEFENAPTGPALKELVQSARPLFEKIMRWEAAGRPKVDPRLGWTGDRPASDQTGAAPGSPTPRTSTGQDKTAAVSTAALPYISGLPENTPIKLSSGRTVVRRGNQLFDVDATEMAPATPAPASPAPAAPAISPWAPPR